jgi:hypothetical protein
MSESKKIPHSVSAQIGSASSMSQSEASPAQIQNANGRPKRNRSKNQSSSSAAATAAAAAAAAEAEAEAEAEAAEAESDNSSVDYEEPQAGPNPNEYALVEWFDKSTFPWASWPSVAQVISEIDCNGSRVSTLCYPATRDSRVKEYEAMFFADGTVVHLGVYKGKNYKEYKNPWKLKWKSLTQEAAIKAIADASKVSATVS